jgi:putative addiction module antidote
MVAAVKKISRHGNSAGVSLSPADLAHLSASLGDSVSIQHCEGGLFLTAHDSDFDRKVAAIRSSRRKFRNAYRELAK